MRRRLTCLALAVSAAAGCGAAPGPAPGAAARQHLSANGPARATRPAEAHKAPASPARLESGTLRRAVARYLSGRPGRAGVMVTDLRTGRNFGYGERRRFVTASVMKVNVLAGFLLQRQRAGKRLTAGDRALAARMIRHSDNTAADALYARVGRGPGLTRLNRAFELRDTEPYPTRWGASGTSPADQVRLLRALATGPSPLNAANRRYALKLMESVEASQAWGVSAAARRGEKVAVKNGWTPLRHQGSGWAVNSVGRVRGRHHDFLVAVCGNGSPAMATGVTTVERLSSMIVTALRRAGAPGKSD
ncbi:serine hydrolase [Spirillospora sp. NPDC047279]|uniref:serine hydrolase n=1 Tax=Spirillospora sp. NPDC047279 TaxID=3155478 RepID=UPI0033C26B2F